VNARVLPGHPKPWLCSFCQAHAVDALLASARCGVLPWLLVALLIVLVLLTPAGGGTKKLGRPRAAARLPLRSIGRRFGDFAGKIFYRNRP